MFVHKYNTKVPEFSWTDSWGTTLDETRVTVERVIAYWSRTLKGAERNYSTTEREALAAKEGLVHFQPFLEGERVLLITDHAALQWARAYENTNRRLAAWGAIYAAFPGLEILHRAGRVHSNVDPLSRLPRIPSAVSPAKDEVASIATQSLSGPPLSERLWENRKAEKAVFFVGEEETEAYSELGRIPTSEWDRHNEPRDDDGDEEDFEKHNPQLLVRLNEEYAGRFIEGYRKDPAFRSHYAWEPSSPGEPTTPSHYFVGQSGLLYFRDADWRTRVCVPSAMVAEVLKLIHDNPFEGAHSGGDRLYQVMSNRFYWPRMLQDCLVFARTCDVCQKVKVDRLAKQGSLRPADIPHRPFETISMDLITGLPESGKEGFTAIFVAVDKLTRYAIAKPTHNTLSAEGFAELFVETVASPFSLPRKIICDRDKRWTCRFWREVVRVYGSTLAVSSAHHPQTDGQTEIMNATLEQMLRAYCSSVKDEWAKWLVILVHTYNASVHSTTSYSPAFLLLGYQPKGMSQVLELEGEGGVWPRDASTSPLADDWIRGIESLRQAARDAIARAQESQSRAYNKRRRAPEEINVGDRVLVNPHSLELVESKGTGRKLIQRRIGPFEVMERINPQVFRLRLPPEYKMHPVINREHLKLYHPSPTELGDRSTLKDTRELRDDQEEYEVEAIVGHRKTKRKLFFRVRWKGYGPEEDSWLDDAGLRNTPGLRRAYKQLHLL